MLERQIFFAANGSPPPLALAVGQNVKRLRYERGLSPETLAAHSGVDAETFRQIEAGEGQPSLALAWRLAQILSVPLTELAGSAQTDHPTVVRYEETPKFFSASLGLSSRALVRMDGQRSVELYELTLAPKWREVCEPHRKGTRESLHVATGAVQVWIGGEPCEVLQRGDTITFAADQPHAYVNLNALPARCYLTMAYEEDG